MLDNWKRYHLYYIKQRSSCPLNHQTIMKLLLLLAGIALCALAQRRTYTQDYCWRDFNQVIPRDAMAHGTDKSGRNVYIGQGLFEGKLIPGTIIEGDSRIYLEFDNQEYTPDDNIKILCSENPENFVWLPTDIKKLPYMTEKMVIGGHEKDYTTYIGRVMENHVTYIGKVVCKQRECLALYVSKNGHVQTYTEFSVLVYSPQSNH